MRVFRVEIYNEGDVGRGVYRANVLVGFAGDTSPMPSQDNKLGCIWDNMEYEQRQHYYFAFESIDSVSRWFTDSEIEAWKSRCVLVEYEVTDYHVGTCQVIFNAKTAVQIGIVDI